MLPSVFTLRTITLYTCSVQVPTEVQVVAERYLRRKRTHAADSVESLDTVDSADDGVAIDIYSTACKRESSTTFHQTGQDSAATEVAALYEIVQNMPDGPQKTHFLKRVSRQPCLTSAQL